MKKGYKKLLEEANAEIEAVEAAEAIALHGRADITFVDLRDPREREREGSIPGAFSCPRGMLEFWVDPESPYAKPIFAEPKIFVFSAPAAGVRRLPPRRCRTWVWTTPATSRAASPPGGRLVGRSRKSRRRNNHRRNSSKTSPPITSAMPISSSRSVFSLKRKCDEAKVKTSSICPSART